MGRRALFGDAPRKTAIRRVLPALGLAFALLPAARVAAAPAATDATDSAHADPFERANRRMYSISIGLDRAIVGPVVHVYMGATPAVLRNRISAFIYNLGEPRTTINDVLQGRPAPAGRAVARLVMNTTVGLGGLFDVASHVGLAGSQADFGQTLGRYAVRTGPYLFIPFLGPADVRDGLGMVIDSVSDPVAWATGGLGTTFAAARGGVAMLDARAQADGAVHALDDATDPYATARSAYLQARAAMVDQARGRAPSLPDFDEPARP
jgi:phospholipid-binding lipoprotein MlaA